MTYAKRLQIEYKDINDIDTRIEIFQEGYGGAVEYRDYAGGDVACELAWGDSSGERLPLVYGSQVTLWFDAEIDYEFLDFFTSNSRKNKIYVYKNNSLAHVAFGEADTWSEPLSAAPYEVSFTGFDGLGLLSDEDFLDSDKNPYTGRMTPLAILQLVLAKTGLVLPLNTAVAVRPVGGSLSTDALGQVLIDAENYIGMSCYGVLEALFQGNRIFQRKGEWWIVSNTFWGWQQFMVYHYTAEGDADGSGLMDNAAFSGFWFEGAGNLEYLPAMKQLTVIQDYGYKSNLIRNGLFEYFKDGNFDDWDAVGVTPKQMVYDSDGNRFVYLPGTETYDNWRDYVRTKYLRSAAVRVEQTDVIPTISVDYALMNDAYQRPAIMLFGVHLVGDNGVHYSLKMSLDDNNEVAHVWEQTTELRYIGTTDEHHSYDEGWWWGKTTYHRAQPVEFESFPQGEITEHFTTKAIQIKEGIPVSGELKIYLFLPQSPHTVYGGSCWRKVSLSIKGNEAAGGDEEMPTETEFTIINDLANNYVPDDLELPNGDLPGIGNQLVVYTGGFIHNGTGIATNGWWLNGSATPYPYAELIARIVASEMRLARQTYKITLADTSPAINMVFADANNGDKKFLETGITYNDRMQAITGSYTELTDIDIDGFTVDSKNIFTPPRQNYRNPADGRGTDGQRPESDSSRRGTGTVRAYDKNVALYDENFAPVFKSGHLSADEFEDETDPLTGRVVLRSTLLRKKVNQPEHGLIAGQPIRVDVDKWIGAMANNAVNAQTGGIVSRVIDADNFEYMSEGFLGLTQFLPGKEYFLSPNSSTIITLPDPEVWIIGQVRQSLGWGTDRGLKIEIDVGDEIGEELLVPGPTGPQGIQGIQGAQGIQGDDGAPGAQGIQGIPGVVGDDGATGAQGEQGIQGIPGADGGDGAQGIQGTPGADGGDGAQGIQGIPGADGGDGAPGAQGEQGIQGVPGIVGDDGATGAQGIQGIPGADGGDGATGAQGIQGIPGVDGDDGAPGAQGIPGADGDDGAPGAQGIQGIPGVDGDEAMKIEVEQIAHGYAVGDAIRHSGIAFVKAQANSSENAQVVGVVTIITDADNFTYQSEGFLSNSLFLAGKEYFLSPAIAGEIIEEPASYTIGEVRQHLGFGTPQGLKIEIDVGDEIGEELLVPGPTGPQGIQGIQGAQGIQGDDGATGAQGIQGIPGADGDDGAPGAQGIQGIPGADGDDGAPGAQGIQGIPGVDGDEGATGAQGIQGIPGIDGGDGATGAQGIQGIPGVDGDDGATGAQGIQGIPGADGDDAACLWNHRNWAFLQPKAASQGALLNGALIVSKDPYIGFNSHYYDGWKNVESGYSSVFSLNKTSGILRLSLKSAAFADFDGSTMGAIEFSNVDGSISASSTIAASNFILSSQRDLKKDVTALKNIDNLENIDKINLVQFRFKNDKEKRLRYGVIAEELGKYFPEMVYEGKNKTVAYFDFLVAKIARLEERINKLEIMNNE